MNSCIETLIELSQLTKNNITIANSNLKDKKLIESTIKISSKQMRGKKDLKKNCKTS